MAYSASASIEALHGAIRSFEAQVNGKISDVRSTTQNMDNTMTQLYDKIERFRVEMMQGEDMQIAQENLLRLDQVLKEQFGNYSAVRRTVMGIIRDCDINLVRNSTIQELSEELWVSSSRYWLSYALIAITAWINNYRDTAENALMECSRRDPVKSSLFFCLMNLRFERMPVAKKWFNAYMSFLDPTHLQRETAVLLSAFLNGLFDRDKELEQRILNQIESWVELLNSDEAIASELRGAYGEYIANLTPEVSYAFQAIPTFCTNAADLEALYRNAAKMPQLLSTVKGIATCELQNDGNYKKRVDAVLIRLISDYDQEEYELKRQQLYYQCIVDKKGNMELAEKYYKAARRLQEESFNVGKQMISWAVYDNPETTDPSVRKFGLAHTKLWFKEAVNAYARTVHEKLQEPIGLKIDGWTFTSSGEDQEEQVRSLEEFFAENRLKFSYVNTLNIMAVILLLVSIGLAFVTMWSLIATAVCALFLVWRIFHGKGVFQKRREAALENLKAVQGELSEYRRRIEEMLGRKAELFSVVDFM